MTREVVWQHHSLVLRGIIWDLDYSLLEKWVFRSTHLSNSYPKTFWLKYKKMWPLIPVVADVPRHDRKGMSETSRHHIVKTMFEKFLNIMLICIAQILKKTINLNVRVIYKYYYTNLAISSLQAFSYISAFLFFHLP